MSSDIVIKVENLCKQYKIYHEPRDRLKQFFAPRIQSLVGLKPKAYFRTFEALKDVSFEVRKGETVGIVGDNFPLDVVKSLSFFTVTSGALQDAFHPGSLALLLIFLIILMYLILMVIPCKVMLIPLILFKIFQKLVVVAQVAE